MSTALLERVIGLLERVIGQLIMLESQHVLFLANADLLSAKKLLSLDALKRFPPTFSSVLHIQSETKEREIPY